MQQQLDDLERRMMVQEKRKMQIISDAPESAGPIELPPDTSEEVADLMKRVKALEASDATKKVKLEEHHERIRNLEKAMNGYAKETDLKKA